MKVKKQNFLFRSFALVCAMAFTILFMPVAEIFAMAANLVEYADYTYITIGNENETVKTTVYSGHDYDIANAYIGGNSNYIVGQVADNTSFTSRVNNEDKIVTIKSSKVTVTYNSVSNVDTHTKNVGGKTVLYFTADNIGTYVVTYSYTYEIDGKEYTNFYDMSVESGITSAELEMQENDKNFLPKVIDLSLLTAEEIELPIPTIYDEDGKKVEDAQVIVDKNNITDSGNYLLVSVSGGVNASNLNAGETKYLKFNSTGELVIDTAVFDDVNYGGEYQTYTVTYSYYSDGQFILSTSKSTTVYESYYKEYDLVLSTDSTLTTSAQPGIKQTLPKATVVTGTNSTPASESVDIYYTVKVLYKTSNGVSYSELNKTLYNKDEQVIAEDGTLVNPTEFTPLEEGYYTFIYTAYDFYGKQISSKEGRYEWRNIEDDTDPTIVVYDASELNEEGKQEYNDASSKLKTNAPYNSVVVYAIGIKDNLSTAKDSDLKRIISANSEELITIEDYDEYNLVFNYSATDTTTNNAYENLLTNNYLIRKATKSVEINSDADMLAWLKDNNYLIVVDNNNKEKIYKYFGEGLNIEGVTDADSFVAWASKNQNSLIEKGFAYINSDKTFGATSANGGFSYSTYSIKYWGKDKAGNTSYITKDMTLTSAIDSTLPTITFSTSLNNTYLPDDTVSFAVPTASDNSDSSSRMIVKTYYRFLDESGVVTVEEDGKTLSKYNLQEVLADLGDETNANGVKYSTEYASYFENGGYIDITDSSVSTYKIDLSKGEGATKVQIFAFAYDDAGNVGVYGTQFAIANAIDNGAPFLNSVIADSEETTFDQGAEIALPNITVRDDLVEYMSYNVSVDYIYGDSRTNIPVTSDSQKRAVSDSEYTVIGGVFTAPFTGDYLARIEAKDKANNIIVVFTHYTTTGKISVQEPVIKTSFESKTVELDDHEVIEIPTPTVDYSIDKSLTYDEYVAGNYAVEPSFVILGVDKNGYATDYSTTKGNIKSYTADKIEEFPFAYEVTVRVYNPTKFTYTKGDYKDSITNYFTLNGDPTGMKIKTLSENSYAIYKTEASTSVEYIATLNENEDWVVTKNGVVDDTTFASVDFNDWADNLKMYFFTSDTYTIIVKDTTGPVIYNYDYVSQISSTDLKQDGGYKLFIQGITRATDASGINYDKSSVTITTTYKSDGSTRSTYDSLTKEELVTGKEKSITLNGTITIKYTVYDNNNNYATYEAVIKAGDATDPVIDVKDDFYKETYTLTEIKDGIITFDLTKLDFEDNKTSSADLDVTYKLVNTSTEKEIDADVKSSEQLSYKIDSVGSYTLTVTVTDEVGNYTTQDFTFEVTEDTVNSGTAYKVIGTILIVISVLVLAGVIIYFIVSKVKLDKELKK